MEKTILLYEPHNERVAHLVFLLNLADIRCTQARSVEETLNWLTAARLQIVSFDLMMIGSLVETDAERQLLETLSSSERPLVYLQAGDEPVPPAIREKAMVCRSDDLLHCLTACLEHHTSPTTMENSDDNRRAAAR